MKAKIHVILPTAKYLHRQILEGILDYGRERGPWQFHFETGFADEQTIGKGRRWGCTGIIAMVRETAHLKALVRTGLPAVFINPPEPRRGRSLASPPSGVTFVRRNQENIGKTAAEYFLDRGYRSFAFVDSVEPASWSRRRCAGYVTRLAAAGFACSTYKPSPDDAHDFDRESRHLADFLRSLAPDTALYAVRDRRALQVLGLCQDLGLTVPDTLAVLGTDDDAVLCEAVSPTLSSIALDGENAGRLCAQLLDRHLHGQRTERFVDLALPRVITRQSTDAAKIADPYVASALALVRRDLSRPLTLADLSRRLGISKRTLETKATLALGHTLRTEIERIRLNEAVRSISNSSLPIQDIAERCGFCSASYLTLRFKAAFGHPPSVFRYRGDSK